MYGGIDGIPLPGKNNFIPSGRPALSRVRLNNFAIGQAILLPWFLFVGTLWLLSSQVRYNHPMQCLFLVGCGIIVPLFLSARIHYVKKRQAAMGAEAEFEPTWLSFLALTGACALALGLVLGESNYYTNLVPMNTMMDLATVSNIDPAMSPGKAYLDVSMITFKKGTEVNQKLSIGFKNAEVYCVAPITIGKDPFASYDFWAVGVGCCNPFGGQFWCGSTASRSANTGYRLMDDSQRPYYRLAVQQATAEYGIHVNQPIFLHWGEDPATTEGADGMHTAASYRTRSNWFFWSASIISLIVQICAVFPIVNHYNKYLA